MTRFPLPQEHRYGNGQHPLVHDGRANHSESMWLRLWQAKMKWRYPDEGMDATGIYDMATLRTVVRLQQDHELPANGWLDEETWNLAWQ